MVKLRKKYLKLALMVSCLSFAAYGQEEITVWNLTPEAEQELALFKNMEQEFEKRYGAKVKHEFTPNEAYKTKIKIAVSSANPPDVFQNWPGADSFELYDAGLTLNLTDHSDIWEGLVPDALIDGFAKNDDGIHNIPFKINSKQFFYNKSFFSEHNLKIPEYMEDIPALCQKIRKINRRMTPISFGNSERWPGIHYMSTLFYMYAGDKIFEDYALKSPTDELFSDQGYVKAFEMLKQLSEADCFNKAPNGTSPQVGDSLFTNGQAVSTYGGSWIISSFEQAGIIDNVGFAFFPPSKDFPQRKNTSPVFGDGYQISSKTQNLDLAKKYIRMMLEAEFQKDLIELAKQMPANPQAIEIADAPALLKELAEADGGVDVSIPILDVALPNILSEYLLDSTQRLLEGSQTASDIMENARRIAKDAQKKQ